MKKEIEKIIEEFGNWWDRHGRSQASTNGCIQAISGYIEKNYVKKENPKICPNCGIKPYPCDCIAQYTPKPHKIEKLDTLFWNGLPEDAVNQAHTLIARLADKINELIEAVNRK